jgi:DNA invertase Pin-like site-specific DNA recombinase
MQTQQPLRAVAYARSNEQRPESIEDQIDTCRRYCRTMGWSLVGTYADAASSGLAAHRAEYERLAEDAERGIFDVIIIEGVDRLSRRLSEVSAFCGRLAVRGIKLHSAVHGAIASLSLGIFDAVAQLLMDQPRDKTEIDRE